MIEQAGPAVSLEPSPQALQFYREIVERCMVYNINEDINNDRPEHAAIIFEAFFRHAKSTVRIFAKNLDAKVFGKPEILDLASKAIARGATIQILLQEDKPQKSAFSEFIFSQDRKKAFISQVPVNLRAGGLNFSTMDSRAYRYEQNPMVTSAVANMSEPTFTERLIAAFDLLVPISTPILAQEPAF